MCGEQQETLFSIDLPSMGRHPFYIAPLPKEGRVMCRRCLLRVSKEFTVLIQHPTEENVRICNTCFDTLLRKYTRIFSSTEGQKASLEKGKAEKGWLKRRW